MEDKDIISLFPDNQLGLRMEFSNKIYEWKVKNGMQNCVCGGTLVKTMSQASTRSLNSFKSSEISRCSTFEFPHSTKSYVRIDFVLYTYFKIS